MILRDEEWFQYGDVTKMNQCWTANEFLPMRPPMTPARNESSLSRVPKTSTGMILVIPEISKDTALGSSPHNRDRRAALFCLGHGVAGPMTWPFTDKYIILEKLVVSSTIAKPSLVNETLSTVLSLVAATPNIVHKLIILGFTVVSAGEYSLSSLL
jgi:hypothetical protein